MSTAQIAAVDFNESFAYPGTGQSITFTASSYTAWRDSLFPDLASLPACEKEEAPEHAVKIGRYLFYNRLLPLEIYEQLFLFSKPRKVRSYLRIYRRSQSAFCRFDAPIGIPVLADKHLYPWMSLTPNEVLTQRGQIRRAKGHVAMAGLGLGWAARRVLERPSVKHLTVIEHDAEVLQFFGKPLQEQFEGRLTLVNGDAYTDLDWTAYNVCLWDVWQGYGDAGWDDRYQAIKAKVTRAGGVCVAWGDIGTNY